MAISNVRNETRLGRMVWRLRRVHDALAEVQKRDAHPGAPGPVSAAKPSQLCKAVRMSLGPNAREKVFRAFAILVLGKSEKAPTRESEAPRSQTEMASTG